jgi:hypothetical protein
MPDTDRTCSQQMLLAYKYDVSYGSVIESKGVARLRYQ